VLGRQPVVCEGFLGAARIGGSDALVNGEGPAEGCGAFGELASEEVAATDATQGARFLQRCAYLAGDGERPRVVVTGSVTGRGLAEQLA
jgi:hypothetical protein